jgi:recombination protein RecA
MSSAVFSTSAAQGRPFVFDEEDVAEICPQPSGAELFSQARSPQRTAHSIASVLHDGRLAAVTPASRLAVRPAPEMVTSGVAAMDALTEGLPRGCLIEICGTASSGRTTLLLALLAAATGRGEFCAVVDASDGLDPQSLATAGIDLDRLLWVRCAENSKNDDHSLEKLLRVSDLLLESGGFGMIALDMGDLPPQIARRIPLATWFRFRRAVEHTPTVLLAIERQAIAGSCSSLLIRLKPIRLPQEGAPLLAGFARSGSSNHSASSQSLPTHAQLLTKMEITAELIRSRFDRKPVRSAETTFASQTAWAG